MTLSPGSSLGPYEILGPIGAGGMGEVYRARDPRIGREVAIKVLHADVATNADRLRRFELEARAAGSLSHPNLVTLFELGTHEGAPFIVMELLEGETLRERIRSEASAAAAARPKSSDDSSSSSRTLGPSPVAIRRSVEIAVQVAEGLAAAHDRGVVHRDLKPENIFLGRDGRVKILDFGLAKLTTPVGDFGESATAKMETAPGTVLGTVGYMSPEQVRGEEADARSDLFSLAAILYEMLSHRRAFHGDSSVDTFHAILHADPEDLAAIQPGLPTALANVVRHGLEKERDRRFQSARDMAFALSTAAASRSTDSIVAPSRKGPRFSARLAIPLAALLGFGAAFGVIALRPRSAPPEPPRLRTLTFSGADSQPTVSPDGKVVAFVSERDGRSRIWLKNLATGGEQALTEGSDMMPEFARDGDSVMFLRVEGATTSVFRQALLGGQPRRLASDVNEASLAPDGARLAVIRTTDRNGTQLAGVSILDLDSGQEKALYSTDTVLYGLCWSPDGREIAVTNAPTIGNWAGADLLRIDVATAKSEKIRFAGVLLSPIEWSGMGRTFIAATSGSPVGDQGAPASRVLAYDLDSKKGRSLFFAEGLFPATGFGPGGYGTNFAIPTSGTIIFTSTSARQRLVETEIARPGGSAEGAARMPSMARDRQPVYSPDGRSVLFSSNRSGNLDLWLLDRDTGALQQITDDPAQDWDPAFSPDGAHIVWSSNRRGNLEIWYANRDGSNARQVTRDGVDAENPTMGQDGRWIVYWSANPEKAGLWRIRQDGSSASRILAGTYAIPDVSPDGRWATFLSFEAQNYRTVMGVVEVETGRVVPFRIETPWSIGSTSVVVSGRNRWIPGTNRIAFISYDERGQAGVFEQEFDPDRDDTSATRKFIGSVGGVQIESFGVSPDGTRLMLSTHEVSKRLMIAEGVAGVEPAKAPAP